MGDESGSDPSETPRSEAAGSGRATDEDGDGSPDAGSADGDPSADRSPDEPTDDAGDPDRGADVEEPVGPAAGEDSADADGDDAADTDGESGLFPDPDSYGSESATADTSMDGGTVTDDSLGPAESGSIAEDKAPPLTRSGIQGPEYDEEMPLADHIEEMLKRLAAVIVVAGSVTIITFPLADQVINFLWYSILPGTEVARPRVYGPLEFLLTQLKVASLAGLIVALPVLVYQSYQFMKPGLYPRERRYYLAAIPTSLVLAVIGMLFAYFIVLPAIFTYFLAYSEGAGEIAFALARTFDLILILMAYLAIVFQIPLAIMLAIMMGITTREWLQEKRLYFWGAFLGIAFISSPDPTGMAPIIIALTMVALFEGTLTLLRWVGR